MQSLGEACIFLIFKSKVLKQLLQSLHNDGNGVIWGKIEHESSSNILNDLIDQPWMYLA